MGTHEDDRIRRKNRLHNDAQTVYEHAVARGLTPTEIINHYKSIKDDDYFRNELYSAVIKIAERSRGETG